MTVSEFRENAFLVGAMKTLLVGENGQPSILAQAIVAVQTEKPAPTITEGDPEIASVRRLSRIAGFDESLELLLSCSEPLPRIEEEEPATFGVPIEQK